MPSGSEVMAAAAMTAPSTKLWNASPTTTGSTAPSCTSQSCVWQWRQSTSFSRTKNSRMPHEQRGEDFARGGSCSSAFGQDLEHRRAEQRADRVAHQPGNEPRARGVLDQQDAGGDEQPAQAAEEASARAREGTWTRRAIILASALGFGMRARLQAHGLGRAASRSGRVAAAGADGEAAVPHFHADRCQRPSRSSVLE